MITEEENKIRSEFFWEKGEKAYAGHINDGDKVIWNENYVKWLESKLHQPTVISSDCEHEWKADTFDRYGNTVSMYCDDCGARQTDL